MRGLTRIVAIALVASLVPACAPKPSLDEKVPTRAFLFSTGSYRVEAGSQPAGLLLVAVRPGGPRSEYILPEADAEKPVLLSPDGRSVLYTARASRVQVNGRKRSVIVGSDRISVHDLASGNTRDVTGPRFGGDRIGAYDWTGNKVVVAFLGRQARLQKHRPQNKATFVVYSRSNAETLPPIPADHVRIAGRTHDGTLYVDAWAGDPEYYGRARHGLWRVKTDGNAEQRRMPYDIPGGADRAATTTTSVGAFFDPRRSGHEWSVMNLTSGRQVHRAKVPDPGEVDYTPDYPSAKPPVHTGEPVFSRDFTHYLQTRGTRIVEGDATTSGEPNVVLSLSTEDSEPLAYVGDSGDFVYQDVLATYEWGIPRKVQLLLYRRSEGRSVSLAELTERGPIRFLGETPVAPPVSR